MHKKIVNLTAHELTQPQLEELFGPKWQVNKEGVLSMPETLYQQVTQLAFETDIRALVDDVMAFVKTQLVPGDYIFVQGQHDFTALLVQYAFEDFVPIYAFSERDSQEVREGDQVVKRSVFRHRGFKPYTPYKKGES